MLLGVWGIEKDESNDESFFPKGKCPCACVVESIYRLLNFVRLVFSFNFSGAVICIWFFQFQSFDYLLRYLGFNYGYLHIRT